MCTVHALGNHVTVRGGRCRCSTHKGRGGLRACVLLDTVAGSVAGTDHCRAACTALLLLPIEQRSVLCHTPAAHVRSTGSCTRKPLAQMHAAQHTPVGGFGACLQAWERGRSTHQQQRHQHLSPILSACCCSMAPAWHHACYPHASSLTAGQLSRLVHAKICTLSGTTFWHQLKLCHAHKRQAGWGCGGSGHGLSSNTRMA
jgi:hypothetical protein